MQSISNTYLNTKKDFIIACGKIMSEKQQCHVVCKACEIQECRYEFTFDADKGPVEFTASYYNDEVPIIGVGDCYINQIPATEPISKQKFLGYFPDGWELDRCFEFLLNFIDGSNSVHNLDMDFTVLNLKKMYDEEIKTFRSLLC
jgi:hypothetical protein